MAQRPDTVLYSNMYTHVHDGHAEAYTAVGKNQCLIIVGGILCHEQVCRVGCIIETQPIQTH